MWVPGLGNLGANRRRFTSRQPISSSGIISAVRQKKGWGRCLEDVVAMGVAVCESTDTIHLPIPQLTTQTKRRSTLVHS